MHPGGFDVTEIVSVSYWVYIASWMLYQCIKNYIQSL